MRIDVITVLTILLWADYVLGRREECEVGQADSPMEMFSVLTAPFRHAEQTILRSFNGFFKKANDAWTVLNGKSLTPQRIERLMPSDEQYSMSSSRVYVEPEANFTEEGVDMEHIERGRKLDAACGDGEVVWVTYSGYVCGKYYYYKEDYERMKAANASACRPTITNNIRATRCYCPKDKYGTNCENTKNITCTVNVVSPSKNCDGADAGDFNTNYGGYPSCTFVSVGEEIDYRTKTTCQNKNSTNLTETFEGRPWWYNAKLNQTAPVFTYVVDQPSLAVSDPITNMRTVIRFLNWNDLSDQNIFDFPLDVAETASGEEVEQSNPVQISSEIMAKSRAGRIFYEIDTMTDDDNMINGGLAMGYLDLAAYSGPSYGSKNHTSLILKIVLGTLAGLLGVAGILWYHYRTKAQNALLRAEIGDAPSREIILTRRS